MPRKLLIILLLLALLPLTAVGEETETVWITAPIHTPTSKTVLYWDFPYSDGFFTAPATQYNHLLARCSLGLALAAYRQKNEDLSHKDEAVRQYLTDAGFIGLASDEYDVPPDINTIATMIGRKKIGDTTLIAIAVSGGDYQKEWESNFTISAMRYSGDEVFHDGFAGAANQVALRVQLYLDSEKIEGPVKFWLTGYSRAAAVTNLAAYVLLECGMTSDDDLYAYTFATPRCALDSADRACPGIFNIVGSFDPVTAVPFPEWGYDRFGATLFLPAQEICADYASRKADVDPVYFKLTGVPYWNNPQCNWLCCKAMQTLDEVMAGAGSYREALQNFIVGAMNLTGSTAQRLLKMYRMLDADRPLKKMLSSAMENTDTLYSAFAYSLLRQKAGFEEDRWNHGVSAVAELIHEHCPDVYVAWMFSRDDPEDLFVSEIHYRQIVVSGDADISILRADGSAFDGQAGFRLGDANMITLPVGEAYTLSMTARSDTTARLFVIERQAQHLHARLILFEPLDGTAIRKGERLALTLPKSAGARMADFTLESGEGYAASIDTQTSDLGGDYAAIDASFSGDTAKRFLIRALWASIALLLALVFLIAFLIVRLCRKSRRARSLAAK